MVVTGENCRSGRSSFALGEYYICVIDLMGQKEFFAKIDSATPDLDTLKHVARVSDGLCEIVRYVENRYARVFSCADDAGIELFSDSVMLSIKAGPDMREKLAAWLGVIVKVVYIACKYELPFRGGIASGSASRSKSGSIYGEAVDQAIQIESECADYPRVVLSYKLIDAFKNDERLSMYFDVDTDSAYVLDYAGPRLMKRPEFARECKALEGVNKWVLSLYKRYCFTGENEHDKVANPKLARRYVMWLDYLRMAEFYRMRNVQDT